MPRYNIVRLKASNDKYISPFLLAFWDKLYADTEEPKEWETFELIAHSNDELKSGDEVYLRANNGKYVCVDYMADDKELRANRPTASDWETFTILKADKSSGEIKNGDKVAFRAYKGQYVSVGGERKLVANQNEVGPLETFTLEIVK